MINQEINYPFTDIGEQTKFKEAYQHVLSIDKEKQFSKQSYKNILEVAELFNSERSFAN